MSRVQSVTTAVLLVLVLFLTACSGWLIGLRTGLVESKVIVQSLVTSQVINQAKADVVKLDIDDGVNTIDREVACVKAITVSGKPKQLAKGRCYVAAANDLRSVLARHNIGGVPQLDRIRDIAQTIIDAFDAYNAAVNSNMESLSTSADADAVLEQKMKAVKREMQQLSDSH